MPPEELDEELLQVPNNEITILGVIFDSPIVKSSIEIPTIINNQFRKMSFMLYRYHITAHE